MDKSIISTRKSQLKPEFIPPLEKIFILNPLNFIPPFRKRKTSDCFSISAKFREGKLLSYNYLHI